ncbi:MAG TPA: hypothetical protein VK191_11940 [Symbiobacteriaceae bacterium]|nr:hypothetical protein [Symbiobacteriaceae bacterium]
MLTVTAAWLLWLTGLGVLFNLLLSLWILNSLGSAIMPYRSIRDLETAYQNGQITRDAYDRFAARLR